MTWAPTTDQLLDLDGVRWRADSFEFELRDQQGTVLGMLHPDMGRPPVITNDTTAAVPRTMTNVHLPASEGADIDVIRTRLVPFMVLQNGERFQLGEFLWASDARPQRSWGQEHATTLADKMVMFNQGLPATLGWGPGADIGLAVLGVALGVLPLDQIVIDPISAALAVGVTHPIGKARRQVLAEFMANVGFLPPFVDRLGRLNLVNPPDMATVDPALVYDVGGRIIDGSVSYSDDLIDAPNVFRVYENSGQATLVGTYSVPASAPHSVANRGYEIGVSEPASGLGTLARANAAARALATTRNVTYRWASWDSTLDPRHDTWDPVRFLGDVWMETRQTQQLRSGGVHSHLARQVF